MPETLEAPRLHTSLQPTEGLVANFQIGGAQKCGTNALFNGLYGDRRICLSQRKEIRFFLDDQNFTHSSSEQQIARSYARNFPDWSPEQAAGEGTPEYMYNVAAIERIHRYNPETRWIICLRNPVVRAFSQWRMMIRNGFDDRPLNQVLTDAMQACADYRHHTLPKPLDKGGVLSRGLYSEQLQRLFALFGRDQVCIFFTSNLKLMFNHTVSSAKHYILTGSKPTPALPLITHHGYFPGIIPEECLEYLQTFYEPEINALANLLNCDLSSWLDQPLSD